MVQIKTHFHAYVNNSRKTFPRNLQNVRFSPVFAR